jgi:pilus assembly protein CpaB
VKARLLTITLAAVLAILGAFAVLAYVRQANERAVDGLKAQTVMVAAGAIPAGTSLSEAQHENLLGTEKLPDSSLSTPALQSVTAANGHLVLSGAVAKGQVLLQNMLTSATGVPASSSFVMPSGMMAVTVDMCVAEAVADYVTPGAYVAVFDTLAGKGSTVQRSCEPQHEILDSNLITDPAAATTLLVLRKAEVLAVGQNPGTSPPGGSNVAAATDPSSSSSASSIEGAELVTLAVDQADAERLILIDEVGLPYLALLGPDSGTAFAQPVHLFPVQP